MTLQPELLRVAQVAAELGCHPETVRRWIRYNKLDAIRLTPTMYLIDRRDLDDYLQSRTSTKRWL